MSVYLSTITYRSLDNFTNGGVQLSSQIVTSDCDNVFGYAIGVIYGALYDSSSNVSVRSMKTYTSGATGSTYARFGIAMRTILSNFLITLSDNGLDGGIKILNDIFTPGLVGFGFSRVCPPVYSVWDIPLGDVPCFNDCYGKRRKGV